MRLARIEGGVVINVLEVDEDSRPDWTEGWPEAGDAGPGWLLEGETLVAPPDPDPAEALAVWRAATSVTRFQARFALLQAGRLAEVEALVAAADDLTQMAWAEATEWPRNSPMIAALAANLVPPMDATELDALFAAALEVSV